MPTTRGQHLIGQVLGSCVLEKLLGYGGSSAVFLAQQQGSERKVAVKVFLPRSTMDAQTRKEFYQRFLREAEAASQLDHPNILPIYSYGEQDNHPYIVMPYMSGGTLSEYVAEHGPLSLSDAQWYLEQMASALDYAHTHGCIHCDVKPANMLIDEEGHVMLSDFGIAHLAKDNDASPPPKNPDALMGTPDYISPEQAMGRPIDARTDIYSLGVTTFYWLAGQLPFKADTSIALALMHVHDPPPSLVSMRADVSPVLDQVVHTALAKAPEQRFQTATAFSNAFTEAVTETLSTGEQMTVAGKSPVLIGHAGSLARIFPALATDDPVGRSRLKTKRLIGATSLLLAVILVVVVSLNYMLANFAGKAPRNNTRITTISGASSIHSSTDLLLNHSSWPTSSTLFFDQEKQLYHIFNKLPQDIPLISLYQGMSYGDFQLSVTMQELRGPDDDGYYGVVFRSASDQSKYYLFEVLTSDDDEGKYVFSRYDGSWKDGSSWKTIASGDTSALLTASGKSNVLTVEARGNHFSFMINRKSLGKSITDPYKSPLTSGQIGLYVESKGSEVAFSHLFVKPYRAESSREVEQSVIA